MEKQGMGLDKLKNEYDVLRQKFNLPEFKEMNEDFHIDKLAEMETEIMIREIRRFLGDKLMNYMRFVENLLNPVNVPMFVFSIVKLLDAEQKKKLEEIYKELMKNEMKFIKLDLEFDEKEEAKFIKDSFDFWQKTKKDLLKIIEKINSKWDEKSETNGKGYFG
ncbi:MAG TPA: hypothetical protein ENH99_01280 [Candidatus Pacearchaeota archaeon]|nr:hypothetical protein [Candidatus Pacearchaeota archaeon]